MDIDEAVDDPDRSNNTAELSFQIRSSLGLAEALDMPDATVTTGGDSAWYGCLSDDAVEGGDLARSGTLAIGQSGWMQVSLTGAGVVTFSAAQSGDGYFTCFVDGQEYELSSYWCGYSFELGKSGTHVIKWQFTASSDDAFAKVDRLTWQVGPLPDKPELSVMLRTGNPQYVALTYQCTGATQIYSHFYRATAENGAKEDFEKEFQGTDEIWDRTAVGGKVYWYWVCASNQYGVVWSDPVRAGWGLAKLVENVAVEVPVGGCETNFAGETSWAASVNKDWLSVSYASSCKGEPVALVVKPNADGSAREGVLTVTSNPGESHEKITSYTIRQGYNTETDDFVITNGVLYAYRGKGGDIVIPETVTNIKNKVFADNSTITSVVIPGTVRTIGDNAFNYCTRLKRVTLGEGIELLGQNAFKDCSALLEITLPDSLCTLRSSVFLRCSSLSNMRLGRCPVL